jgi:hypothetical protein
MANRAEREHQRYAHEAEVTLLAPNGAQQGRTTNVSRGGFCANMPDPIPVGIDLDVQMVLVFDDDAHSDALKLPARVVWCTPVDEAHQVGISFRGLSAEQANYLSVFLRYLDDGLRSGRADRDLAVDDRFG